MEKREANEAEETAELDLPIFKKGQDAEGEDAENDGAWEDLLDLDWGIFGSSAEDDF